MHFPHMHTDYSFHHEDVCEWWGLREMEGGETNSPHSYHGTVLSLSLWAAGMTSDLHEEDPTTISPTTASETTVMILITFNIA